MGSIRKRVGWFLTHQDWWVSITLLFSPFVVILVPVIFLIALVSEGNSILSKFNVWRFSLVFIGGIILLAAISITLIRVLIDFQRRKSIKSAKNLLISLENETIEYCLVLRPFGSDGSMIIERKPLFTIGCGGILILLALCMIFTQVIVIVALFFSRLRLPKTFEKLVSEIVGANLGYFTVALGDPKLKLFPTSVFYFNATDENWKATIDILLRRASIVILAMQPGTVIGNSTKWEIERIKSLDMTNRLIIVLPPANSREYKSAYESLMYIESIYPSIRNLSWENRSWGEDERPLVIGFDKDENTYIYCSAYENRFNESEYADILFHEFERISPEFKNLRFQEKFPHWNPKLVENFFNFYKDR